MLEKTVLTLQKYPPTLLRLIAFWFILHTDTLIKRSCIPLDSSIVTKLCNSYFRVFATRTPYVNQRLRSYLPRHDLISVLIHSVRFGPPGFALSRIGTDRPHPPTNHNVFSCRASDIPHSVTVGSYPAYNTTRLPPPLLISAT